MDSEQLSFYITKAQFREKFESEFKTLCRLLKEHGKYKFAIRYLFSHKNKNKDMMFEAMCNTKYFDGQLMQPSLALVFDFLPLMGIFDREDYGGKEQQFWRNYIKPISDFLREERYKFINYGHIFHLTN